MSESKKVTKKRKWESTNISWAFKLLAISVPSKIILHWANICFSENDYFRADQVEFSMNYKHYEQNTHFIPIASSLRAVPLLWNVASAREWDFTAQQFWWSWVHLRTFEGTLLTMQMDVRKTLYPFYNTKTMPHVTVTIINASLTAIARYISITTISTVGYLQVFNAGHFFSSKHCHDL